MFVKMFCLTKHFDYKSYPDRMRSKRLKICFENCMRKDFFFLTNFLEKIVAT